MPGRLNTRLRPRSALAAAALLATLAMAPTPEGRAAGLDPHDLRVDVYGFTRDYRFGRDFLYVVTVSTSNPGTEVAGITLTATLPPGTRVMRVPPECTHAGVTVTCALGTRLPDSPSGSLWGAGFFFRPPAAGPFAPTFSVSAANPDPDPANNNRTYLDTVYATPPGVAVPRYRLFSPASREHHFTTDVAEYIALGNHPEAWIAEGVSGQLLDNPGTYNGVEAVPCYRLYHRGIAQHLWTTDPNEYYTLIHEGGYLGEGIDGFLLPVQAPGTVPLYRLYYPFDVPVAGLHHWTIDANEYNALISTYGWIGEGGSGFVIP